MFDTTYIELDSAALKHNIETIKQWFGDEVLISSVVKGNAYGHGLDEFVPLVLQSGIQNLSVFSAKEAYSIINNIGKDFNLMIMGMIEGDAIPWAILNDVEFFVFDTERLLTAIDYSKKLNRKARIHIELETGMNRTGFESKSLTKVLQLINDNRDHLDIKGVCTHFAGAESISNYHRIKRQREKFKKLSQKIVDSVGAVDHIHAACSAASLMYPNTRYDMVRIGILQYGFFPSNEVLINYMTKKKVTSNPLKRVLSWKSIVMDVNEVRAGEFIGYGTSYLTNTTTRIAMVPVGYSHGFKRTLSNHGRVLIHGRRLNVVGMVNMNMMAVDVTDIESVKKGDEVVLIGKQGDSEISVSSFSDYSNQINYELLTRLPHSIQRIIK